MKHRLQEIYWVGQPLVQDRDKLLQEKELLVKRSKSTGSVLVRARACTRCN